MTQPSKSSARRVQEALDALGVALRVVELPRSARTAAAAAEAIGCSVAQIAKSLIFRGQESGTPILAVASGRNQVSEERLGQLAGEAVAMADPEFVRTSTGFAIGGVPPIGYSRAMRTWIDADLLEFAEVWAAAGTPNAVFCIDPTLLASLTGGEVVGLASG